MLQSSDLIIRIDCNILLPLNDLYITHFVRGAPSSAADYLHGQRTWAFLWRPVLRPSQEHRPILSRPYPELHTRMAVWSGVINVFTSHSGCAPASPDMWPYPLVLSRMHTIHNLHPSPHPTLHSHDQLQHMHQLRQTHQPSIYRSSDSEIILRYLC